MSPYTHIHAFYTLLAVIFLGVLSYMLVYNRRSRNRQKTLENRGSTFASHEGAIHAAQEPVKPSGAPPKR